MYRKFILPAIALCLFVGVSSVSAQISLGTAQNFAVLGGQSVTNAGASAITGNVGVSPGSSVTGFPPGVVTGGAILVPPSVADGAQADLTTAYLAVAGTACNVDLTGQDLGGLTLTPAVYCFSSDAFLTGTLILDFQGNPNAVFLFKIGTAITTAVGSAVVLSNNVGVTCPPNVYWQVGSSAVLEVGSTFVGNILALTSISMKTGARLSGRALARNGSVTLDTNNVALCAPAILCPVITVNPATLPNGTVGTAYNQTITANGGLAPYTFAVTSGALPNGLTLSAAGAITGTPLSAGTSNFTITATDANGCPGTRAYSIVIVAAACPIITLSPATLPPVVVGGAYNQTITASGGTAPYAFTVTSGSLPPGLTLNSATGVISGTAPAAPALFNFTIQATDGVACPGSRAYSIAIACPVITLTPSTLPPAVAGVFYSQTIVANGGRAPYTFSVSSGTLPGGLSLNATTGAITGTPTTVGQSSFSIRATDANACLGTAAYAVTSLGAANSPTLGFTGLALLTALLGGAALFVIKRISI